MRRHSANLLLLNLLFMPQLSFSAEGNFTMHWQEHIYSWHYNPNNKPGWLGEEEALEMIQGAAAGWEACGIHLSYEGITDKIPGDMDGENVVGWKLDGKNYSAWTTWSAHRDGRAIEADVMLYTNIFNKYLAKGIDARVELHKSITHEFGHVLGLSHSDRPEDAMSVKVRTKPEWQQPSDNDIERCRSLYP